MDKCVVIPGSLVSGKVYSRFFPPCTNESSEGIKLFGETFIQSRGKYSKLKRKRMKTQNMERPPRTAPKQKILLTMFKPSFDTIRRQRELYWVYSLVNYSKGSKGASVPPASVLFTGK